MSPVFKRYATDDKISVFAKSGGVRVTEQTQMTELRDERTSDFFVEFHTSIRCLAVGSYSACARQWKIFTRALS